MDAEGRISAGNVVDRILMELVRGSLILPPASGRESPAELVGTAAGGMIGIVIAKADSLVVESLGIGISNQTIGIIGAKTGSHMHVLAVDEGLKGTNARLIISQFPVDSGGDGYGCLLVVASDSVSDARRAVEISLGEVRKNQKEHFSCKEGAVHVQYTSYSGAACQYVYGVPEGTAFGLINASPAVLGIYLADIAIKSAGITPVTIAIPGETHPANESTLFFTGENSAVRCAAEAAREAGKKILASMNGS